MVEKKLNESEAIDAIVTTPYKYGFTTNIGVEEFDKGLNSQIVKKISEKISGNSFPQNTLSKSFFRFISFKALSSM